MDRPTTRTDADAQITRIDLAEPDAFLPPSRQAQLDLCRAALELGPILVTGDAGVGKTWLVDRLTGAFPGCRWAAIDLTPADGPADLYRHLARGLGLAPDGPAPTRPDVAEALADRSADDQRHALVIDEAQNLAPAVWEEVRILANRLGRADGFAHLILVGQTALARRFATRALAAVEARLAGHVHLRPLDLAEAGAWLAARHPRETFAADDLEAIHRDSGGNPARLLRRSAAISARLGLRTARDARTLPSTSSPIGREVLPGESSPTPRLAPQAPAPVPPRPPLHVEENAIEVGWSSEEAAPPAAEDEGMEAAGPVAARAEPSDQAVHDHYAALQAWREWASNQEKRHQPAKSDRALADEIDEAAAAEAAEASGPTPVERGQVRAEGHQHFAPFGQLFSRLNVPREGTPPTP